MCFSSMLPDVVVIVYFIVIFSWAKGMRNLLQGSGVCDLAWHDTLTAISFFLWERGKNKLKYNYVEALKGISSERKDQLMTDDKWSLRTAVNRVKMWGEQTVHLSFSLVMISSADGACFVVVAVVFLHSTINIVTLRSFFLTPPTRFRKEIR